MITDPFSPSVRLGDGPLQPLPQDDVDIRQPVPLQYDSTKSVKIHISLATIFFNFLNLGERGGADNDFEVKYESDSITTTNFTPTSDYVDKTVMQEAIQGYLRKHRTSLYMIVGV